MLEAIKKGIAFVELMIGILLPWQLRCKYSELLLRLDRGKTNGIISNNKKERDFDMFFHLGSVYVQEKKVELAIENLNKAIEIDPNNNKVRDIHLLLSACYKIKGELDKAIDEIVIWHKKWKRPYT